LLAKEEASRENHMSGGSLEESTCLSAAQEAIPGEPTHLASFPFLHLLFSRCLAERSLLAADWKKLVGMSSL